MTSNQRQLALMERYPWHRHNGGESFFVPTLNPDEVMREGLVLGRQSHPSLKLRAKFGIVQGQLGVLFTLLR
jgi:hypothetical protein